MHFNGHQLRANLTDLNHTCENCGAVIPSTHLLLKNSNKYVPWCLSNYPDQNCKQCKGDGCKACFDTGVYMRQWDLHFINWPRRYMVLKAITMFRGACASIAGMKKAI